LSKADDIFCEALAIVEAHRVITASVSESLVERADALSAMAASDPKALAHSLSIIVLTNMYAQMTEKIERAAKNPEYAEALFMNIEEETDARRRPDGGD
jgi:hypothetical protein